MSIFDFKIELGDSIAVEMEGFVFNLKNNMEGVSLDIYKEETLLVAKQFWYEDLDENFNNLE